MCFVWHFDLAVSSREVQGTLAAVLILVEWVFDACSSILARQWTPVHILTVWSTEARLALAVQAACCLLHTVPTIQAS